MEVAAALGADGDRKILCRKSQQNEKEDNACYFVHSVLLGGLTIATDGIKAFFPRKIRDSAVSRCSLWSRKNAERLLLVLTDLTMRGLEILAFILLPYNEWTKIIHALISLCVFDSQSLSLSLSLSLSACLPVCLCVCLFLSFTVTAMVSRFFPSSPPFGSFSFKLLHTWE